MSMRQELLMIPNSYFLFWQIISVFERQGFWLSEELNKVAARFELFAVFKKSPASASSCIQAQEVLKLFTFEC